MSNLQERNYSIDGLRGGSALLIVCYKLLGTVRCSDFLYSIRLIYDEKA